MPAATATPDSTEAYEKRWWTLAVLCLSIIIVFVGNSSLNVAIPTLSRDLHATSSQLQWVVAIYSLVFAGLLFSTGAIGDRFGRKGALQFGLLLFLIGAAMAAASTSMAQLIACRAIMGVAGAFIMPSTLSIIINVFPPGERSKAIAIWASFTGAAGSIGPVGTGLLLGHFWYGSVFLINIPFIVLALIAGRVLVPNSKDPDEARLDPGGALLSTIGIVALVYGLIEAPDKGWGSASTMIAFAIGIVVLIAFSMYERKVEEPMLDMSFFRNPAFSAGSGGMILVFMAMYGATFLITQYFQLVLGYSPLGAAIRFLPTAAIMLAVAPLTPRISAMMGPHRQVAFSMLCVATALLMFRGLGPHTSYGYLIVCFMFLSFGMSNAMPVMTASIMSAVPARRAGAGSSMNDATRELGASLGVAVMGSLAASRYTNTFPATAGVLSATGRHDALESLSGALNQASKLSGPSRTALEVGARHAFIEGIHMAVSIGAVLAVLAAIAVYKFLPKTMNHSGATHGPLEAFEDVAELGVAGVPPLFADSVD
ncbi:MAG: drug resistance transporter, EmrB/QacA subfamily [Acidimicrobiia bacterium]|nr:drug resistance transporter, EmrB/QacA subfamily [Acidimicrobiia bacterium]